MQLFKSLSLDQSNYRMGFVLLSLVLLLLNSYSVVKAAEPKSNDTETKKIKETPLKISILSNNSLYSYQLPNGRIAGFYVEFWELWSQTTHRKIEFIAGDYNQNIHAMTSGTVDFHSGLFATKNRDKWANYSVPFDRVDTSLFHLKKQSKSIKSILDAKDLKIAIQPFSSQIDILPKKYPEINFVSVDTYDELIEKLMDGELDAIIGETYTLQSSFRSIGAQELVAKAPEPVTSNSVYALIPKGNPKLVKLINQGIINIPTEKLINLAKKWLPDQSYNYYKFNIDPAIGLSKDEEHWLKNLGDLQLGIGKFWKPIEFLDKNLQPQGISSDYLLKLKSDLGVFFELDKRLSWTEVINKVKERKIDVLSAVGITETRKKFLNFSEPYMKIPMVIVVKKNSIYVQKPNDLAGYSIGASRSNPIQDIWKNNYPNIPLQITSSSNEGLQAVQDGKLDAFLANLITIGPKMKNTFTELEVVAVTPHNINVAIGVRKGLEEFIPILNKWLKNIPTKEKLAIRKVWLGSEVKQGTSFIEYATQWSPLVIIVLLISGFIIRKNMHLSANIKKRIAIESALEKAKHQSEIANINKEQFLANISHEVRTPINALVGTAHLLEMSGLDSQQKEYIEMLNYSANSLLLLVDDISDFSRMNTGDISLENKLFDFNLLLKNIFAQSSLSDSFDNIRITYDVDSSIPEQLIGDPHRLGQILTNLLSNAVKFTSQGSIRLDVTFEKSSTHQKKNEKIKLIFALKDTGIGMSKEQQDLLFQAYSQTDKSIARKYGGTGLGLTISKKLCELMQGKISVKSQTNQGSCFTFKVILEKPPAKSALQIEESDQRSINELKKMTLNDSQVCSILINKHVLLVDDNSVNLMIAKKILTGYKIKVTTAVNGKKAVEAISSDSFDLVLMDIQMPEMDGYQTTQIIRNKMNLDLPIIALSANVMKKDRELSQQSGMDAHLGKPIKVDELLTTLAMFLS